jgi:hypothetical protein
LLLQLLLLKPLSQLKPLLLQLRQLLLLMQSQLKLLLLHQLLLQHQLLSNSGFGIEKAGFRPCFFCFFFSIFPINSREIHAQANHFE